jgi:hypothetical protein
MTIAVTGIPPGRLSTAIAVYTVFRQVGTALGTAA